MLHQYVLPHILPSSTTSYSYPLSFLITSLIRSGMSYHSLLAFHAARKWSKSDKASCTVFYPDNFFIHTCLLNSFSFWATGLPLRKRASFCLSCYDSLIVLHPSSFIHQSIYHLHLPIGHCYLCGTLDTSFIEISNCTVHEELRPKSGSMKKTDVGRAGSRLWRLSHPGLRLWRRGFHTTRCARRCTK